MPRGIGRGTAATVVLDSCPASGDLHCQARFADPTRTRQGGETVVDQTAPDALDFGLASDETRELRREILRGNTTRGAKRRELVRQV